MWKIVVGFIVFAAVAMFVVIKGGDKLDMGGEKHGVEANSPPPAAPAAMPVASVPAPVPAAMPSASVPAASAAMPVASVPAPASAASAAK